MWACKDGNPLFYVMTAAARLAAIRQTLAAYTVTMTEHGTRIEAARGVVTVPRSEPHDCPLDEWAGHGAHL